MPYLVLARKYRPRTFAQMVGQEHVVQALSNALSQQRLHHAYLFTGTRGVGKTTVSRILAKSLNCVGPDGQGGITAEPCGVCQPCRDIDAGRFVDYVELDAASNRGVDEVQALLEQAVYKPVVGRFKVFMIDEVHMLTGHAFNAMLKTLEEPPEYLKFVLATTDPQKVPVTVLSRCLQFNLRPMPAETVATHLAHVLSEEKVDAEPAALRLLARAARGSMRDALSLTDQAIAFGGGSIREDAARQMLGTVDRAHVFGLIDALARGDGKTVVGTVDGLRLEGLSAASSLEEMSSVLQRMAVEQAVPGSTDATDPDAPAIVRLAAAMPADETQLLYSMCLQGAAELPLAPDEYAGLVMVLLRLLAFKPAGAATNTAAAEKKTPPEASAQRPAQGMARPAPAPPASPLPAVLARAPVPEGRVLPVIEQSALRKPLSSQPIAVPAQPSAERPVVPVPVRTPEPLARERAVSAAAPLQPTEEGDFWHGLVQQLVADKAIQSLARELALQSQLLSRADGRWTLRVEADSLAQPAVRDKLQAALLAAGHAAQLAVESGSVSDSPARRNQAEAVRKEEAARRAVMDLPFVQSIVRDYEAKMVPGSLKPVNATAQRA